MENTLIAKIDHKNKLIFQFDDLFNLDKYKETCKCDICKKNIDRVYSYIINTDKGLIQVGSGCIRELIDRNLNEDERMLIGSNAMNFDELIDMRRYKRTMCVDTKEFIVYLSILNKKFGYKFNWFDKVTENKEEITNEINSNQDKYELIYNNVIDFYKNYGGSNNFISNIKSLILQEKVDLVKFENILKYAIKCYLDDINYKNKINEIDKQEEFAGDKFTVKSYTLERTSYIGYYSWDKHLVNKYIIITDKDFVLEWDTSKTLDDSCINKTFKCKIKNTYNSVNKGKVTVVTNCREVK